MSLVIKRCSWTEQRVHIHFAFVCDTCGAVEERCAELCVRPHEGRRVAELPQPPASWRAVDEKHYCGRHDVRLNVRVIENPKQKRLPLEGKYGSDD